MKNVFVSLLLILCTFSLFAQRAQDEQLAIQYYSKGEFEKAKAIFKPLFDKKADIWIYSYYFPTLLQLEDYKECEKIVKAQQKQFPQVYRYAIDLGYVYERMGDLNKAIKEYDYAIRNLPANEHAYRELHYAFLGLAKRDYAIDILLKARKVLQKPKLFSKELVYVYTSLKLTDKIIEEALTLVKDAVETQREEAQTMLQNLILEDEDKQAFGLLKTSLQKEIQKDPNNLEFLYLLFWAYQLNKEFTDALLIAKSLDKRMRGEGELIMELAKNAVLNRDYDAAKEAYAFIISKGEISPFFTAAKFQLLEVKYQQLLETSPVKILDAKMLEQEFKQLIDQHGIHSGTADWTRKYAHLLAFFVNKSAEAIAILTKAMDNSDPRDPKQKSIYKIDLGDILLHSGNIWDATLFYSQVDKDFPNDTIGQMAKFKNAKLSFYIGEFEWAKSQLDILRAATSKLIANDAMQLSLLISDNEDDDDEDEDEEGVVEETPESENFGLFGNDLTANISLRYFAKADFMLFQNNDNEAIKYLDSIALVTPLAKLNDNVLFLKAKIFTRQKKYLEAEKLYKRITEIYADGLLGDDALFYMAELYEYYLKDTQTAMTFYQKLLKDYPGSLYVVDARKRFRSLRGDY